MDPIVGGALINAGGSLLGGLFGKKAPKPSAMVVSHIKGVMDAAERFKLNPLTILQNVGGPTQGSAPPNYVGAAISDAASFAADAFLKKGNQQALQVQAYQEENERLNKRLVDMTLRPKVPGVYGGGDGAGVAGGAAGVSGAGSRGGGVAGGGGWVRPLTDSDIADPRREVQNEKQRTHSGFLVIDSPWGGKVRVPTLDGDEALDIFDLPAMAVVAPQLAWNLGSKAGEWLRDSPASPVKRHGLGHPTGYTEDGRPFWQMPDGSVRWSYKN